MPSPETPAEARRGRAGDVRRPCVQSREHLGLEHVRDILEAFPAVGLGRGAFLSLAFLPYPHSISGRPRRVRRSVHDRARRYVHTSCLSSPVPAQVPHGADADSEHKRATQTTCNTPSPRARRCRTTSSAGNSSAPRRTCTTCSLTRVRASRSCKVYRGLPLPNVEHFGNWD